jgi:NAD(P)-dependent dehydrogenase (short-subunit alcohol dehydrogenase family)
MAIPDSDQSTEAMTSTRLDGKRVLLTQANDFMGPALCEVFARLGAEVIADDRALAQDPALPGAIVRAAGRVDVLLVHLALPAPSTPAGEIGDAEWREVPLGRLVSAEEDALFAAYLCSDAAACFVGQVFPVSGGWANR